MPAVPGASRQVSPPALRPRPFAPALHAETRMSLATLPTQ